MKIDVVAKVDEVKTEDIKNKTVIVIDVLRATSTIVTALAYGAKEVIAVETIGQARQYRGEEYLLAGERYCKRIAGFPFTNSPTELSKAPIKEKSIVLTTTNGTRAIQKSLKANKILIGSFLNGPSTAKLGIDLRRDITILCAGSRQKFALEDGIAAGYILSKLLEYEPNGNVNDFGISMLATYQQYADAIPAILTKTETGKRLVGIGSNDDIAFCAQTDIFPFVPIVKDNGISIDVPSLK